MLKIISIILFYLFLLTGNCFAQEKIVFIDINYIFKNSNAGKDLNEQISKKDKELKLEASKFRSEIEKERKQILSQKNVLSVEEYNKKIKVLEESIKAKNSELTLKNNEFILFKKKIETSFSKKLNSIIRDYSLENSINLILNKENLLMAKKNLDITEKVFNLFNQKIDKIEIE